MSTLSELLPAGSGGKNVDFVASGTLASGEAVAIKTDGKVETISTTTAQAGTMFEVTTAAVTGPSPLSVYATNADRMVIVYSLSGTLYYKLGEVSSFGITLGSETAIPTISTTTNQQAICYDETNERVVVFFKDSNNSDYGTAIAGTVSTSGITWGTTAIYNSTNTNYSKATAGGGKVCVVFTEYNSGTGGSAILGTISGNNITFPGTRSRYIAGNSFYHAVVYSEDQGNFVVFYDQGSTTAASTPLNINGNNITLGSEVQFNAQRTDYITAAYDKTQNKTLITYLDNSTAYRGIVGTNSGSAMSFGTEANANSGSGADDGNVVYDPHAQQCVIVFGNAARSNELTFRPAVISGTDVTFPSSIHVNIGVNGSYYYSLSAYTSQNKLVTTFYGASGHADGVVYQSVGTNSGNFIGITDAAIADTATGSVTIKGGIGIAQATSQSNSLGSAQLFNDGTTNYSKVVYDSNSDRIVVIFADNSNLNYGTAIVGEVSGSSVQYGTKEVFNTGTASYMDITFDSNSNRVVIAFTGTPANEYGTAIVGSVDPSDNSIDFGTASVYKSATCSFNTCTFDSSNNKVVVGYRIYPSPQGIARVGTVDPSDNSISFTGAESVYVNGDLANQSSTFDSSNNKVVITFQDGTNTGRGTAIVGTVSGTGISFGSKVDFSGANNTNYSLPVTFDSNSNKIVVLYSGPASTYLGRAKVGTISGTAITFGSEATFEPSNVVRYKAIAFDSTANKVIIVYDENQTDLKYVVGTVSGTDITFETPTIFSTSNGVGDGSLDVAYDSSINRSVFAFRDESNSNKGTSQVLALAGILENLTPNNVYYVQSDGTISTNSAGTRIGKALSTTSINLEFNS